MAEILDNTYFWSALALLVLAVIGIKYGRAAILGWLDGEIAKIRNDLAQAQALRREAEQLLAQYQQKQRDALQEAEAIVAQAQREADQLRAQAGRDLQDRLARGEQQAMDRIARAEVEAVRDVRLAVVDLAAAASAQVLREQMADSARAATLNDQALADLSQKLKAV